MPGLGLMVGLGVNLLFRLLLSRFPDLRVFNLIFPSVGMLDDARLDVKPGAEAFSRLLPADKVDDALANTVDGGVGGGGGEVDGASEGGVGGASGEVDWLSGSGDGLDPGTGVFTRSTCIRGVCQT